MIALRAYAIWQKNRWIFAVVFILGLPTPALNIVRMKTHLTPHVDSRLVLLHYTQDPGCSYPIDRLRCNPRPKDLFP